MVPQKRHVLNSESVQLLAFWCGMRIGVIKYMYVRECPIIRMDLQIRTTFGCFSRNQVLGFPVKKKYIHQEILFL